MNTENKSHEVLIYYKYSLLENPEKEVKFHRHLCEKFDLKGRILIAKDGINGTVEGTAENNYKYIDALKSEPFYKDIYFKKSPGTGNSFPKLQVRTRSEIVTTMLEYKDEIGPLVGVTGKYITSQALHSLIHSDNEFYIIDMRNDYEYSVGYFENSVLLKNLKNFRDLPNILPEIEHLKEKQIVTVCTSGVRCEMASGFLIRNGFANVSQLKDGIMEYMQTYPNEDFVGKLFVFDNRVVLGFNTETPQHKIVGSCIRCGISSENFVDHRDTDGIRKFQIVCKDCISKGMVVLDQ
jgi:UPF0176 protein